MSKSNDIEPLNTFERIDAILFDPEINMRPKLAALVSLRRENKDSGTSWASNLTYAAAVGSTDPRAGSRARRAAIKEGLISATSRPGRAPIVQVNAQRIYSIHDRLNAERAKRKVYSVHDIAPVTPANSGNSTPAISSDSSQSETPTNSHDTTPAISRDTAPANSDDTPLPIQTTKRINNEQSKEQKKGQRATSAQSPPLAGANSSIKEGASNKAEQTSSEVKPPVVPQAQILSTTIEAPKIAAASFGAGCGNDINNINPHAHQVRQNRRYGALTALDGSEGVIFDLGLGKLSLANGTLAAFEQDAEARGLDLSAALTKAATKLAKDPRNATPAMALAEINQALAYQEHDKRNAGTAKKLSLGRGGWGARNFKGI